MGERGSKLASVTSQTHPPERQALSRLCVSAVPAAVSRALFIESRPVQLLGLFQRSQLRGCGERGHQAARVSALWSAQWQRARLTPFPGSPDPDPGNKSGGGANTRPLGSTRADLGAVLLQSSPLVPPGPVRSLHPEVLTLTSSLHSWGNRVGVVPEQGMRWGLGLDASCRPASKTLLCGSPGRRLASGGASGGRDPGSGESRQEGLWRMGGDSPGPG